MPMVGTFQAAGVISRELEVCYAGRVGLFRNQPGDVLLQQADLILTVGFEPIEYDPELWKGNPDTPIISVNVQMATIRNCYHPTVELWGDIAKSLDNLTPRLTPRQPDRLIADLARRGELPSQILARGAIMDRTPIHPLRLIHALRNLLDDDTTVICDVGSIYMWMARYYYCYQPRKLLFSNGQQTLGVGLPWAIAASLIEPGNKIVSMSGDGGFLFSATELETAVRVKADFVHLVWRDGSYDMVKIQERMKYGRDYGVDFGPVDLVRFAESFGATGMAITRPEDIVPVLRKALDTPGPVLVDVPVDYADNLALCGEAHEQAFS